MSGTKRVVVLLSGNGSNLQALLDHQQDANYDIIGVISNKPDVYGLERARAHHVAAIGLDHKVFSSRDAFDRRLFEEVNRFKPDFIVLAGYMRILSTEFVEQFSGRIINIHPSLLPKYKGLNTYRRVLEDRQSEHGTTVHFVIPQLDSGTIITQASLQISPADDESSLKSRVQAMEHKVYPQVLALLSNDRLKLVGKYALLDNHPLEPEGYQLKEDALELP